MVDLLPAEQSSTSATPQELMRAFVLWTQVSTTRRRYWLRVSVFALGASLLFLPAPFVSGMKSQSQREQAKQNMVSGPPPPTKIGDRNLRAILYTAQVAEAAARRDEARRPDAKNDLYWVIAAGLALVLVFGLAAVPEHRRG
jgi:hypothetical protein